MKTNSVKSSIIRLTKKPNAKLAQKISETANKYICNVEIVVGSNNCANIKSTISFLSVIANIKIPAKVKICCYDWDDDYEALDAICKLLRN